jgi:hypothetical protein
MDAPRTRLQLRLSLKPSDEAPSSASSARQKPDQPAALSAGSRYQAPESTPTFTPAVPAVSRGPSYAVAMTRLPVPVQRDEPSTIVCPPHDSELSTGAEFTFDVDELPPARKQHRHEGYAAVEAAPSSRTDVSAPVEGNLTTGLRLRLRSSNKSNVDAVAPVLRDARSAHLNSTTAKMLPPSRGPVYATNASAVPTSGRSTSAAESAVVAHHLPSQGFAADRTSRHSNDPKKLWKHVSTAVEKAQGAIVKADAKLYSNRQARLVDYAAAVKQIRGQQRIALLKHSAAAGDASAAALLAYGGGGSGGDSTTKEEQQYLAMLEREVRQGGNDAAATMALFKLLDAEVHRAQAALAQLHEGDSFNGAALTGSGVGGGADVSPATLRHLLEMGGFSGTLMPFQVEGVAWLVGNYLRRWGCILADEMGLGKTVQAIALLHAVRGHARTAPPSQPHQDPSTPTSVTAQLAQRMHLIIVPLSTINNWESEFERFSSNPPMRVACLHGDASRCRAILSKIPKSRSAAAGHFGKGGKRARAASDAAGTAGQSGSPWPYDVIVVPHHHLAKTAGFVKKTLLGVEWGYVIIDEAQRIKSTDSTLTEVLLKTKSLLRVALTGTPLQNNLLELWSFLAFLLPTVFSNRTKQLQLIFQHFTGRQADARSGRFTDSEEKELVLCTKLHRLLAPLMLRREKIHVIKQLPTLDEATIYCPVTTPQLAALEAALKATTMAHRTAAKVLLHPFTLEYEFGIDESLITHSGKFFVLDAVLKFLTRCRTLPGAGDKPHKVLVFSSWITTLDMVRYLLEWRGYPHVRLDGRVALEDRQTAMRTFAEDPETNIFLVSKGAGGIGLNLQAADTVVLLDVHYNPQSDLQALARAWRVGQKRAVKVLRLVTDTLYERRVMDIAQSKVAVERKVIAAGKYDLHSTHAEREDLLRQAVALDDVGSSSAAADSAKARRQRVGAENATPLAVEAHLKTCFRQLARGEDEAALMRRMLDVEGLLNDLVADVGGGGGGRGAVVGAAAAGSGLPVAGFTPGNIRFSRHLDISAMDDDELNPLEDPNAESDSHSGSGDSQRDAAWELDFDAADDGAGRAASDEANSNETPNEATPSSRSTPIGSRW